MSTRIILFTGKGGVGKTTCAAATALRAAESGLRTLILSSDPAHSLADALDQPLGPEPQEVVPNLFAQEVDMYYSMQKYWGHMRELMLTVFKWQGIDTIAAEELAALPGMNEGSVLLWIEQFYASGDYDLIVVDSAPTGETLTFLTLPQATEWWLTKAFPFQNVAMQTLGKAVRKTTGIPLDKGYEELKNLFEKLKVVNGVLSDPSVSTVRLVMNPEKMVIQEARRAFTYLQLYGYGLDAVLINRILPETVSAGWDAYLASQAKYLEEIENSFSPLPILRVPHLQREVFGLPLLREIATELYGDRDPSAVFHQESTYQVTAAEEGYWLEIRLPFVEAEDLATQRYGDQLVLALGSQRRHYLLPQFLAYYTLSETTAADGWVRLHFVPSQEEADA